MNKNLKVILVALVTICVVGTLAFSDINGSYATDYSNIKHSCPMKSYTIHYNTNGGNKIDDTHYGLSNPKESSLPSPTKNGYTFIGWYYDEKLTKKVEAKTIYDVKTSPKYGSDGCNYGGETTIYAKWTKDTSKMCVSSNCYKTIKIVTFNTNGGSKIEKATVNILDKKVHKIPESKKDGYVFDGWYYDSALTKKVETSYLEELKYTPKYDKYGCPTDTGCEENIDIYAKWTKDTSKMCVSSNCYKTIKIVTFNTNGGSKIEKATVNILDKKVHKIPESKKDGYVFDGWYYDSALTKKVETSYLEELKYTPKYDEYGCPIDTGCEENIDIYAKWTIDMSDMCVVSNCAITTKIITFNTNGGNKIEKMTVNIFDKNPHKIPKPTKSGYTFAGWYYDSGLTKKVNVANLEDLVHETKYDERGCPIVTCDDATFELYAKWTKNATTKKCNTKVNNKYTLTYKVSNSQNLTKKICVGCNDNPTLINLERNGYVFAGWYYDSALTKKVETENTSDIKVSKKYDKNNCHIGYKNVTLYPKWIEKNVCKEEKTLTILFDTLGGSNIEDIKITSKEFTVFKIDPEIPTKENYTFVGWYYDSGLTNKVDTNALTLNNNTNCEDVQITLYAKYISVDTAILKGKIYNSNNAVLAYAKISLDDELETISDNTGYYELENVSDGNHELIIKDINDNIISKTNVSILNQTSEPDDEYTLIYSKDKNIIDVNIKIDKSGNIEFTKNNSKDINSLLLVLGLLIIVVVAVIISKNSNNKPNESEELDAE